MGSVSIPRREALLRSARGAPTGWYMAESGLFSNARDLVPHECFWDESSRCSTER